MVVKQVGKIILGADLNEKEKNLKKFHAAFRPSLDGLCERYEMTNKDDELWLCTRKLLDIGVDIEEWNKEVMDQCT